MVGGNSGAIFLAVALLLVTIAGHVLETKHIHFLKEPIVAIMVGILGSVLFALVMESFPAVLAGLEAKVFFNIVLPPMIFSTGYSMRKDEFFDNFGTISVFGVLATLANFALTAGALYYFNRLGWFTSIAGDSIVLAMEDILLWSTVVSCTDVIVATAILDPSRFPVMYGIVSGEGIMNDGVVIGLFQTILSLVASHKRNGILGASQLGSILLEFIKIMLVSILIGFVVAALVALYTKYRPLATIGVRDEIVTLLAAYLGYETANYFDLSGILAGFFSGIFLAQYSWFNMTIKAKIATLYAVKSISYIAETFTFLSLGIYMFHFRSAHCWSYNLTLVSAITMFVSRGIFVAVFSNLLNNWRHNKLTWRAQIVIWYSGIIRGAISFVLCLQIPTRNAQVLLSSALALALFTILFLSPFTKKVIDATMCSGPLVEENPSIQEHGRIASWCQYIDNRLLKRFFCDPEAVRSQKAAAEKRQREQRSLRTLQQQPRTLSVLTQHEAAAPLLTGAENLAIQNASPSTLGYRVLENDNIHIDSDTYAPSPVHLYEERPLYFDDVSRTVEKRRRE